MSPAKKNPQYPKIPLIDPNMPIKITRLDDIYGESALHGGYGMTSDPIDALRREEEMDAVKELREIRRDRKRHELKKKIKQERAALGQEDAGGLNIQGMYQFTPADIQQISKMPEAEQQQFYSALQNIQMMAAMQPRGGTGGLSNPMLQMMAMGGFGRQGQGLGLKDVMEIQQMTKNIYDGAGKGNQDLTNTLLLKLMTETVPGLQQQASQAQIQGFGAVIQMLKDNQSDPMRDLNYLKQGAAALGYTPQNVSTEVAKMRIEMEDRWATVAHEDRRKELEYRRQLGVMEKVLDTVTGLTKNVTRDHISTLFKPKQQQVVPQPQVVPVTPTVPTNVQGNLIKTPPTGSPQIVKYQCQKCGADMYAPQGQSPVTCAQCGQVHEL